MKKQPVLENCFECKHKVFEFEDNHWGCDTCKTVWTYTGKTWVSNKQNQGKKLKTIKVRL
jgi:hypothetical protein